MPESSQRHISNWSPINSKVPVRSAHDLETNTSEENETTIRIMSNLWRIIKEHPDVDIPIIIKRRFDAINVESTLIGDVEKKDLASAEFSKFKLETPLKNSQNRIQMNVNYAFSSNNISKENKDEEDSKIGQKNCGEDRTSTKDKIQNLRQNTLHKYYTIMNCEDLRRVPIGKCARRWQCCNSQCSLKNVIDNLNRAISITKCSQLKMRMMVGERQNIIDKIEQLEENQRKGTLKLKKAYEMWTWLEIYYNTKIKESQERAEGLRRQLKELEDVASMWRKKEAQHERQYKEVDAYYKRFLQKKRELLEKVAIERRNLAQAKRKKENLAMQVVETKNDLIVIQKSIETKVVQYKEMTAELEQRKTVALKVKKNKDEEDAKCIDKLRNDLKDLSQLTESAKHFNADLQAECDAIRREKAFITDNVNRCKEKCKEKIKELSDKIQSLQDEYQCNCYICHVSTDTFENEKFCTDCIRCLETKRCKIKNKECYIEPCVCMKVKKMFVKNVFDNMRMQLEKQLYTPEAEAIKDLIHFSLERTKTGKFGSKVIESIKKFFMIKIKAEWDRNIIGGAIKTRCEMDPYICAELEKCLMNVEKTVIPPPCDDKAICAKLPCSVWGSCQECNCPGGPDKCICSKNIPERVKQIEKCVSCYSKKLGKNKTTPGPAADRAIQTAKRLPFRKPVCYNRECREASKLAKTLINDTCPSKSQLEQIPVKRETQTFSKKRMTGTTDGRRDAKCKLVNIHSALNTDLIIVPKDEARALSTILSETSGSGVSNTKSSNSSANSFTSSKKNHEIYLYTDALNSKSLSSKDGYDSDAETVIYSSNDESDEKRSQSFKILCQPPEMFMDYSSSISAEKAIDVLVTFRKKKN